MADDIVTQLRKEISKRDRPYPVELLPELREAADEIELLRFERDNLARNADECRETLTELRQRVETLTAERDEANANAKLYRDERDQAQRALLILLTGNDISMMHRHANERGWDCFKGDADAR
jgi:chromosome segregation ATPase